MSGTVRVGRGHQSRQRLGDELVGRSERGCERSEVDIETALAHRIDGSEDVAAGLTLDEWFDGELDPQHALSVMPSSDSLRVDPSPDVVHWPERCSPARPRRTHRRDE